MNNLDELKMAASSLSENGTSTFYDQMLDARDFHEMADFRVKKRL